MCFDHLLQCELFSPDTNLFDKKQRAKTPKINYLIIYLFFI